MKSTFSRQVSTTVLILLLALLLLGGAFRVLVGRYLEHNAHNQVQPYTQAGSDARIRWDGADLKFFNTTLFPIRIQAEFANDLFLVILQEDFSGNIHLKIIIIHRRHSSHLHLCIIIA